MFVREKSCSIMERYSTEGVASGRKGFPPPSRITANTSHSKDTHDKKSDSDFSNIVALSREEEAAYCIGGELEEEEEE